MSPLKPWPPPPRTERGEEATVSATSWPRQPGGPDVGSVHTPPTLTAIDAAHPNRVDKSLGKCGTERLGFCNRPGADPACAAGLGGAPAGTEPRPQSLPLRLWGGVPLPPARPHASKRNTSSEERRPGIGSWVRGGCLKWKVSGANLWQRPGTAFRGRRRHPPEPSTAGIPQPRVAPCPWDDFGRAGDTGEPHPSTPVLREIETARSEGAELALLGPDGVLQPPARQPSSPRCVA